MTGYPERSINGTPPSWLHQPRPTRGAQLVGACIHATRSGYSDGDDGPRTENWELSQGNGSAAQGWGSSCDLIIFENGLRVKVNPDIEHRDCNYGAGFGQSMFTWSCGWYYEQIEMAQGVITDEYTFAQIDSLAEYLVRRGYPPVRIPFLTQTLGLTPPAGICTHEDSENGKKLGKSDPGPKFPWALLFQRMAAWSGEEDDMANISDQAAQGVEDFFGKPYKDVQGRDWPNFAAYLMAFTTAMDGGTVGKLYGPLGRIEEALTAAPPAEGGSGGVPLDTPIKIVKA